MSSGLLTLLDDVAAIAKLAASSLDDVAAGALKASSKAAGVVIDDTAVTPKYVVGLSPSRELPIVWNIAKGSLKNKLLILLPIILLLGHLVPWSIQPLLAIGGLYLCFEGYEKLHHTVRHLFLPSLQHPVEPMATISPHELETMRTAGAIRTDFILSAEIMAIAYATVRDDSFPIKLAALITVALCITAGVYGVVAMILKADDFGLQLVKAERSSMAQSIGRMLVHGMPTVLSILSFVGTAAMLWVGGGILIHSFAPLHHQIEDFSHGFDNGAAAWAMEAAISLLLAIPVGLVAVICVKLARLLAGRSQFCIALCLASIMTSARTPLAAQDWLFGNDRQTLGILPRGGGWDWTDQLISNGWRIQQQAGSEHYRLLNPHDRRLAVGSFEYCLQELNRHRTAADVAANKPHVVVLLHGLAGSRSYMSNMEAYLRDTGGFQVISFGYASTKCNVQELTVALENVLRSFDGVERVSFVAHSLGNILVRHLLFRYQNLANPPPIEFERMVMISPPNRGALLADSAGQRHLAQTVLGPVVDQLAPSHGWRDLEPQLATPWFEFGILAGGKGNSQGYLAAISGDDDGLLPIDTHDLEGASDFLQVGGLHPLMPHYKATQAATVHFLRHGHFPR
ncbi:MAG: DUF808 family protein [Pirellulaceae bacterium]|nr:DUF808 family protein [Pirellulaceae bacterium]